MNRRVVLTILAALAVACASPSCASPSSRISRLYAQLQQDAESHGGGPDASILRRRADRAKSVREIAAGTDLVDAQDLLRASVILVENDRAADLKLAEELALRAAEKGEPLGFRVAAEAADKQLVKQGLPQRYGTQYEWVPVLRAWRLYPVDPRTTDAERRAMGLASLADLRQGEERLNPAPGAAPR